MRIWIQNSSHGHYSTRIKLGKKSNFQLFAGGAASNRDSQGHGHLDGTVTQRGVPAQRSADPPVSAQ